ncbi:MAG TPA: prolyl oligopeptidase family serine peptidase [Terriglobales bacterium]|nr:prolyl oligopeptidase family serine peptidase [Terriglobales bacterium]
MKTANHRRRKVTSHCVICIAAAVSLNCFVRSQQRSESSIVMPMEQQGCAAAESGTKICKYDYDFDGKPVESILFRPAASGRFPGVLMIPGYERTARDLIYLGVRLANAGFAGIAVSLPGFGKSQGPPDFVGPKTLAVLTAGYRKLQREPFVDPTIMGIYGYSRGGMAASLLATELDDVKAAVFGAGVYDFKKLYDESPLPGVRVNMKQETGMTNEAIRQRSSILRMEKLNCPVLILHGEKDKNVPVTQALLLRDP